MGSIAIGSEPPAVAGEQGDQRRIEVFVNESRIYLGSDEAEVHKILNLLELVFCLTKADAKVQVNRDGEYSTREYFQGGLIGIPTLLAQAIDGVDMKEKFGG